METPTKTYTAREIADALGLDRQAVQYQLRDITAAGQKVSRGNQAAAWLVKSLPAGLQEKLDRAVRLCGCRDADHLLSNPAAAWAPKVAFAQASQEAQSRALKLMAAQSRALATRNDKMPRSEWEAIAVKDYKQFFGYKASARHCVNLIQRTIQRAGSVAEFSRRELYLDDSAAAAQPCRVQLEDASDSDFDVLAHTIRELADPQHPSASDIDLIWLRALRLFNELSASANVKKPKKRVLEFLWRNVPGIAATPGALRRNFDRKLESCLKDGFGASAIADGRVERRGVAKVDPIPEKDIETIVGYSLFICGGRSIQAINELRYVGERFGLAESTLQTLNRPHGSKSHVNRRILNLIVPRVRSLMPFVLGKQAIDDATPPLRRDYSGLRSMTVLTADDFTWPVYFYVQDAGGTYQLTRGQCLLFIDCRSLKILGFSLQPERNYNSLVIRSLDNKVCRAWGIPRVKLFERGIWKNAKVVTNAAPVGWVSADAENNSSFGWEQLGLRIIHAKRARSKPAERVGGLLQNFMERVPGYCGRNERKDCPEVTRKNILSVQSGRELPHGKFPSFEEWAVKLEGLIELYNSTKQEGYVLNGLSPDEAFEKFWPHEDPPSSFDGRFWPLYAHYVSKRRVTAFGISFRIGKEQFSYCDEALAAHWVGQEVLAWFDPEAPEHLGVTDLKKGNPIIVSRQRPVDFLAAIDPGSESAGEYRREVEKAEALVKRNRALFRILKKNFEPTFALNGAAPREVMQLGPAFEAGRQRAAEQEAKREQEASRRSSIERDAQKLGIDPALIRNHPNPLEVIEAFRQAGSVELEAKETGL
jgi:hypothetical protein